MIRSKINILKIKSFSYHDTNLMRANENYSSSADIVLTISHYASANSKVCICDNKKLNNTN